MGIVGKKLRHSWDEESVTLPEGMTQELFDKLGSLFNDFDCELIERDEAVLKAFELITSEVGRFLRRAM